MHLRAQVATCYLLAIATTRSFVCIPMQSKISIQNPTAHNSMLLGAKNMLGQGHVQAVSRTFFTLCSFVVTVSGSYRTLAGPESWSRQHVSVSLRMTLEPCRLSGVLESDGWLLEAGVWGFDSLPNGTGVQRELGGPLCMADMVHLHPPARDLLPERSSGSSWRRGSRPLSLLRLGGAQDGCPFWVLKKVPCQLR